MTGLNVTDLSVARAGHRVLDGVSFDLAPGDCLGLLGPNGAGKTTLMRAALSLLAHEGQSSLDTLSSRVRAQTCAWLPQMRDIAWPVSVEALIALGRLPHAAPDPALIDAVIARMGLEELRHRPATELSGGEQARVLIARALAQDTPLLMADEPIAGLDPAAQIATMRVFRDLAHEGRGVMLALHDLGLAARYCTRLLLMKAGRIVADGPPLEVLTPARLADVFQISGRFTETDQGPVLHVIDALGRG